MEEKCLQKVQQRVVYIKYVHSCCLQLFFAIGLSVWQLDAPCVSLTVKMGKKRGKFKLQEVLRSITKQ